MSSGSPVALERDGKLDGAVANGGGGVDDGTADEEAGVDNVGEVPNETDGALEGPDGDARVDGVVGDGTVVPAARKRKERVCNSGKEGGR